MKTIRAFIIGVVTAALFTGAAAEAKPGATQDANDTSYKNDIRAVYHNDSGSTITYYVQFFDAIDPADWRCYMGLDFNEDAKSGPLPPSGPQPEEDANIDFTIDSATVHDRDYARRSDASVTRAPVGSPHSATGSTAQNTLKISVTKAAYVAVGMSSNDTGYRYALGCGDANPPGTWGEYPAYGDRVPDNYESYPIVHTFGGGTVATPKPKPQTPKPQTPKPQTPAPKPPTSAPAVVTATTAPEPTETPTPSPTATPENETVANTSPFPFEETSDSDDGGSALPIVAGVLVAGGLASAGALTLARRRAG